MNSDQNTVSQKRKLSDYLLISLKGIGMGAADVIPGVSGGTIAFISGIYGELLDTIKNFPKAFKNLFKNKFNIKLFWAEANLNFLSALLLGIAISFLSLAKLMEYLLINHPISIWSFFFGLIIASTWYVVKQIDKWNWKPILSFIIGAFLAYWITAISPTETPDAYWFIFLSGAIAICAMILPGISGSFILLLLGKYYFMLNAISTLNLRVILVFITGAAVGILSFSNVLSWLLKNFHNITVAALGGFMLGSLNKIWPWKEVISTTINSKGQTIPLLERNILPQTFGQLYNQDPLLITAILIAIVGFSLVFAIEKIASFKQK